MAKPCLQIGVRVRVHSPNADRVHGQIGTITKEWEEGFVVLFDTPPTGYSGQLIIECGFFEHELVFL